MSCLQLSDQEILKVIEPMVDSILHGIARRDYNSYSANFSVDLKSVISPESFMADNDVRSKKWGRAGERAVTAIFRKDKSFTVVWNQQFDGTDDQVMLLATVAVKGGRYFIDHLLIH